MAITRLEFDNFWLIFVKNFWFNFLFEHLVAVKFKCKKWNYKIKTISMT